MVSKLSSITSVAYHNIFNFKLTKKEIIKWQYKNKNKEVSGIKNKQRVQNEKYSQTKLILAKKTARLLSKITTVKFVGITGALAMNNAGENGDIDLIIITKADRLWITRLISYFVLSTMRYVLRKPRRSEEQNALCLNMWLDESDLIWNKKDRNIYTAHEIAQIVPLVNVDNVYEKLLWKNKWILQYWPKAVIIKTYRVKTINHNTYSITKLVEYLSYKLQYHYMKKKMTREVATPTRALFHPNDWGSVIIKKLTH